MAQGWCVDIFFTLASPKQEDEERQQLSIPAQIDELREYARKENLV